MTDIEEADLSPFTLLYIYAQQDEALRDQLERRLSLLKRQQIITTWWDQHIGPGKNRQKEFDTHLNAASIILLLISPDFFASDDCFGVDRQHALERRMNGGARVVPVILRSIDWRAEPLLNGLQPLPTHARAVTNWRDQDEAFADIEAGIHRIIEELADARNSGSKQKEQKSQAALKKKLRSELTSHQQLPPPVKNDNYKKSIFMHLPKFVVIPIIVALIGAGVFFAVKGNGNPSSPDFSRRSPSTPGSSTRPPSTPIIATPGLVQNERASSSASPNVVAFHQPVARGDFLAVAITQYERRVLPLQSGVTDDQNDVYHLIASAIATPDPNKQQDQDYIELYYAPDAKGGVTKITVTFSQPADSDGGDTNVGIYEFSELRTVEQWTSNTSNTNLSKSLPPNTLSAGQLSTTGSDDVCFAVGVDSGPLDQNPTDNTTISPGTSYTFPPNNWQGQPDQQEDWQNGERFYTEYDATVVPGGCNPNFKIHYAATWAIISAAFRS